MGTIRSLPGHGNALNAFFWVVIIIQIGVVALSRGGLLFPDTPHYLEQAHYLAQGQFAVMGADGRPVPDPAFPVGYPLFLSVCIELLRLPFPLVVTLQLLILLVSVAFLQHALARHGIPGPAFAAAVALYPFPFVYCTVLAPEALTMALLMATVASLLFFAYESRTSMLIAAGTCYGLAVLFRPSLVSTGPAVLLLAAFASRGAWSSKVRSTIIISLLAAMILMPFSVWNAKVFGKFSPLPTESPAGLSLFLKLVGEEVGADAAIDFSNNLSFENAPEPIVEAGLVETLRELNAEIGVPTETHPFNAKHYVKHRAIEQANRSFSRAAVDRIRANPYRYARSVVRDFGRLWVTSTAFTRRLPSALAAVLIGAQLLYLGVALFGLGLTVARKQWLFAVLCAIPLSMTAIHSLFHLEARYTASVRWAAWIYFSIAALWLLKWLEGRLAAGRNQNAAKA